MLSMVLLLSPGQLKAGAVGRTTPKAPLTEVALVSDVEVTVSTTEVERADPSAEIVSADGTLVSPEDCVALLSLKDVEAMPSVVDMELVSFEYTVVVVVDVLSRILDTVTTLWSTAFIRVT